MKRRWWSISASCGASIDRFQKKVELSVYDLVYDTYLTRRPSHTHTPCTHTLKKKTYTLSCSRAQRQATPRPQKRRAQCFFI